MTEINETQKKLKELVGRYRAEKGYDAFEFLKDLEKLSEPEPTTMDKIRWNDADHFLGEASNPHYGKVIMLHPGEWSNEDSWIYCFVPNRGSEPVILINPSTLAPTGAKAGIKFPISVGSTIERSQVDLFSPRNGQKAKDKEGDLWTYDGEQWVCEDYGGIYKTTLDPVYAPYQIID